MDASPDDTLRPQEVRDILSDQEARMTRLRPEMEEHKATYLTRYWAYTLRQLMAQQSGGNVAARERESVEVNRLWTGVETHVSQLYPHTRRTVLSPDESGRGDPTIAQACLNAWWRKEGTLTRILAHLRQSLLYPGSGLTMEVSPGRGSPVQRVDFTVTPYWEMLLDCDVFDAKHQRFRGRRYWLPLRRALAAWPQLADKGVVGRIREEFLRPQQSGSVEGQVGSSPGTHENGSNVVSSEFARTRGVGGGSTTSEWLEVVEFCVTGDTRIQTRDGAPRIADVVGRSVGVWNGEEWSEVTPRITGADREVRRVHMRDGSFLDCTPEHRWLVRRGKNAGDKWLEVATVDLRQKDEVVSFSLGDLGGESNTVAYEWGLFAGDGYIHNKTRPMLGLFCEKQGLIPSIAGAVWKQQIVNGGRNEMTRVSLQGLMPLDVAQVLRNPDATLPDAVWSMDAEGVRQFVAGWIDTDGTVTGRGTKNEGYRIYGVEPKIRDLQMLLRRIGIDNASIRTMPFIADGMIAGSAFKRNHEAWYCQIPSRQCRSIPTRLKKAVYTEAPRQGRWGIVEKGERKPRIVSVETLPERQTTYCVSEPKRHMAVFGNALTFQCNLVDGFSDQAADYQGRFEVYILGQAGELAREPLIRSRVPFADSDGVPLPHVVPTLLAFEPEYPLRGIPPLRRVMPQQRELNTLRTEVQRRVRQNVDKIVLKAGVWNSDAKQQLASGINLELIQIETDEDIRSTVMQIATAPIGQDIRMYADVVERDLNVVMALSANRLGQQNKGATAYEVQSINMFDDAENRKHATTLETTCVELSKLALAGFILAAQTPADHRSGYAVMRGDQKVTATAVVSGAGGDVAGDVAAAAASEATGEASVGVDPAAIGLVGGPPPDAATAVVVADEGIAVVAQEQSWSILDPETGSVTEVPVNALDGNFVITFVDGAETPLTAQAQQQNLIAIQDKYMQLWGIVQEGGPMAILARRYMVALHDKLKLPKDLHPDRLQEAVDAEEKKAGTVAPTVKGPAVANMAAPAPEVGDGTQKLLAALGQLAEEATAVGAADVADALAGVVDAVHANDIAGAVVAMDQAYTLANMGGHVDLEGKLGPIRDLMEQAAEALMQGEGEDAPV